MSRSEHDREGRLAFVNAVMNLWVNKISYVC
jgi:hypothetical protein